MYARSAVIALLALPLLASAAALRRDTCSSGPVQCCNQYQTASDGYSGLYSLLNIPVNALVGVDCTPINVLAVQGRSCSSQTVCCSHNNFEGAVALGCNPINLNT